MPTTISTSALPESGIMKGPKIRYGMYLLGWAGGEGKQTMSLLRLGAQWPEAFYLDLKDRNCVRVFPGILCFHCFGR